MKKAWNTVVSEIKEADGVLEVLDARCPVETRSKKLEEIIEKFEKPYWIVINKTDIVPKHFSEKVKKLLKKETHAVDVIFVSAKKYYGYNILRRSIKEYFGEREVKLIIVGFPNVGKSSLINAFTKESKVRVSSKPGFTKGKQWVKVSSKIIISDSPGVIPKEYLTEEWREILFPNDPEIGTYYLLEKIKNAEGTNFELLYDVPLKDDNYETIELIAKKFNFLRKGGEFDTVRASQKILEDWNSGKLIAWWI